MKYRRFLLCVAPVAILAAVFMAFPGCEDDPQTTDLDRYFAENPEIEDPRVEGSKPLTVTPANGTVTVQGQQIAFRALGGPSSYRWAVATPANGTITPSRQSDSAVYTATLVAPNTVVVSDSRGHSAIVDIKVGGAQALQITPNTYTFTATNTVLPATSIFGAQIRFTAVGGVPPYNWTVSIEDLGTIAKEDDTHAIYTVAVSGLVGDNQVTLTDAAADIGTATVKTELSN